ncbi:NFX1-type zinc finger-containing protein 1 [Mycena venus]|uniref:NFX1-type zinc finger-containing protein 1 n=1 Tax=Mycena venus TaxID=2733690 RepID=A0A8H7CAS7_9AGAR|nr:NFX1-type zinc finger-containing protein 1 [Mycena venus]
MARPLDPARRNRLNKVLNDILQGKQKLTAQNNNHFIEAICIQDPAKCLNDIISLPAGLTSIQSAMRFDLTNKFFNGQAADLLTYLQTPTLADISGGSFLHQVIMQIVQPSIFWGQFTLAFRTGQLHDSAQHCFAWLLLHLISTASELSNPYLDLARDSTIVDRILASQNPDINALGQQITHFLELRTTGGTDFQGDLLPGGRHDNDFEDFREITILPTADEISCTKPSFLRSSSELEDPETVGKHGKRCKWGITLQCKQDLPIFNNVKDKERKAHLESNSRRVLKHQSLTCLIVDDELVGFPTINRDEELLSQNPPILVLQLEGDLSTSKVLRGLKNAKNVKLIQINTAVFAFEPVLKALQEMRSMRLAPELLFWSKDDILRSPVSSPGLIIDALTSDPRCDLQPLLNTPKPIVLDASQAASLLSALTQKVSLIQGPPGTGKSFIGALLAKALVDFTGQTILVVCYTNHALDQFLEDLVAIGIPPQRMVRLGKANSQTESMSISSQGFQSRRSRADWTDIDALKQRAEGHYSNLRSAFEQYKSSNLSSSTLLEYLEFEDSHFYDAFLVPSSEDMTIVGRGGQAMQSDYLLHRWTQGNDAGALKQHVMLEFSDVWNMSTPARKAKVKSWKQAIMEEQVERIVTIAREYNETQADLARKFNSNTVAILQSKRIIGCTTTAAAKYTESIQAASPGVLLVEEAGEILESHVLTALGHATDQLILIGDHQQLRPKVNNYSLTVEKGDGYELNRPLRGLRDVIVFINHAKPEDEIAELEDRRDMGSSSSKQNTHEVQMVLKIVKYLAQQGYGTEKLVVLTPYLGQLSLLRTTLAKETDPVLNDLDSSDLIRAGVALSGHTRHNRPLRLATIDNYQGEESDIVIVSLTRSNSNHDIGFMFSPERVNVLLSRARNCLIMVGNAETFQGARKGKVLWTKLIGMLQKQGHLYDGLPVKCERHPERTAVLKQPDDFEIYCPDGGCSEPCGALLRCGLHRCIRLPGSASRATINCENAENTTHADRREAEELKRRQKQEEEQRAHEEQMAEYNAKIAREQQAAQDALLAEERAQALRQKQKDLDDAAARARQLPRPTLFQGFANRSPASGQGSRASNPSNSGAGTAPPPPPKATTGNSGPSSSPSAKANSGSPAKSVSEEEWERQKRVEGSSNDAIDKIMGMIGLEDVKAQDERFNIVLQGNPGTGKTTVARHYANFLGSVGVIPGTAFIETTGSRLSNEGIPGIKAHVEKVEQAGGGAMFIDEAYQLTNDYGQGKQVLDWLLAEMENKVGTIVFIFAGYRRELEKFFEHNPGLGSRVPYNLHFADYTDEELLRMLDQLVSKKFRGAMKMEDGSRGLYARIATRRLGRGRGQDGFGNARALHNLFARIHERQAVRLQKERKEGRSADDFLLTKEDLIGPDPSLASTNSVAWKKLQSLIGLDSVKETVRSLINRLVVNYKRELQELSPVSTSLNRVFFGSPGTGKTTVAKLYGQILLDLGLLSRGEVVVKNPSDFVGAYLGHSEKNTKAILATTIGKVLVIDEAYMLYSSGKHGIGNESDSFKTAVIDTLVAEIQSVPGEDRAVLLLGYEDKMVEMFEHVNPGLSRRFAIEDAFRFEDFTEPQLREILDLKLKEQDLRATDAAKIVALEVLGRARHRPNFGNAGEVENVLGQAKTRHTTRHAKLPAQDRPAEIIFEPRDFDADFDRGAHASGNLAKLFQDIVGCDYIMEKLGDYQRIATVTKERGMEPRLLIPTNFVFKGPPGTGKTTLARKMAQVYFDMGFLSTKEVHECSASDLIGQYVGHTGQKTKQLFEKALGKEAIDELVGLLTNPRFQSKVVVILAGYDQDMNNLMAINTGLSSRFPEEIIFHNMNADDCLEDKGSAEYMEMGEIIDKLSKVSGWGNARDMRTLAKQMAASVLTGVANTLSRAFWKDTQLTLPARDAIKSMKAMLDERTSRATNLKSQRPTPSVAASSAFMSAASQTTQSSMSQPPSSISSISAENEAANPIVNDVTQRDPGVTDEIWRQLEIDKAAAKNASNALDETIRNAKQRFDEAARQENAHSAANPTTQSVQEKKSAELKARKLVEERERLKREMERRMQEAEQKRKREVAAQNVLRRMGVCVQGFPWIKQAGGYSGASESYDAQIQDLVQRNRTLEHTNKKLVDEKALDADRNKRARQEERALWREGCNRLLSCHHLAHLRLSAKLSKAEAVLLKEMELCRQEKVARLHRDFQITMFRIREGELETKIEELEDALQDAQRGHESHFSELEERIKNQDEEIITFKEEKSAAEKELLKLRESYGRLQVKAESTESKLERMTLQFDGARTTNADLERENEELKRTNADLKRYSEKWQSLETKGSEEVDTLRKQRIALEVDLKTLEGRLEKKESELQKEKNKVAKHKKNVDEFEAYIKEQREEARDVENQLAKAKKQVEKLQLELDAERAARPISPLKQRQASPTVSEDEVANDFADVSPPSSPAKPSSKKPKSKANAAAPSKTGSKKPASEMVTGPSNAPDSDIEEVLNPTARSRGKAKALDAEVNRKTKPRSRTAGKESSEDEDGTRAIKNKGKRKQKAAEVVDDSDSDAVQKESPRSKNVIRGKRKRDDDAVGASNRKRTPSEEPEVVERPKPKPRARVASGGRAGSVRPRGTTVISDEESDEPARKKKKRAIGLFPANSQPTSFNFLPMGGAGGGIDIPTVLSPVRESDVVPSRSMVPSRTGSSTSVMGSIGGLLSSFGRRK